MSPRPDLEASFGKEDKIKSRNHPYSRMGQRHAKPYRHHQDPIALTRQTLAVREHMFGDSDVVVVVKGHRFPAHREVLAENSAFFKSAFAAFSERLSDEVELKELVEPTLMAQAIHFVYFKNVYLNPRNAMDLLSLSSYLQMPSLVRACSDFVSRRIDRRNAVALYLYTLREGPYELQRYAEDFILAHFEWVVASSKGADLAMLTRDQLTKFLSSDRLQVSSEGAVYRAVLRWVAHDQIHRAPHLPQLLQHVHFPLMSINEVEQHRRDSRVKKSKNLAIAFEEAKQYFSKDQDEKILYWSKRPKPARWPKILVVMRMYWKNLPMEYYDFKHKQWNVLTEVQYWRSCAALVSHGNQVYLIGGEEKDPDSPTGSRTVNRVTKYDCELKRWSSAQSMNLARRWGAAVAVGNTLYVIGGIGGRGGTYERRLDSVEFLDLTANRCGNGNSGRQDKSPSARWRLAAPMSTARSSHTVEVLDGRIYVVGGGDGREWFSSSECYDPKRDRWYPVADMRTRRWKCGLCALNGYLYAVGGMDSKTAGFWGAPLKSVERYLPATDEWTEVAPLNCARFGAACVAYKGKIYVSGGFGAGKDILNTTECYDPETNKWTTICAMKRMCGFVGGVLVDRPIHFEGQ